MVYKEKLVRITDYEWKLPKSVRKGMNVDAVIFGSKPIIDQMEDDCVGQLTNVAMMPGVVNPVVAMPDAHFGYGFPVGSVAAFDMEKGVISAGLCGFDINCGINVIRTNLTEKDIDEKKDEVIQALFKNVPCGVGAKGRLRLEPSQLDDVIKDGIQWCVENGYGIQEDVKHIEEEGRMEGADPKKISDLAKKRGKAQLGTLGAGNHFLEIQKVDKIFDEKTAKEWGITDKDQVCIMIHCGSRGFGHQVATDYLKVQEAALKKYKIDLPDRQLACAPITSKEGQDYFDAMRGAVNYSFSNRWVMTHWVRESFEQVFKKDWESMEMKTIYGLCHNVVKKETHTINGEKREVMVHRKGATRAFPGLPVLIAGSMGTSSYILKGAQGSMDKSYGSSAHGAGRQMSRRAAIRSFRGEQVSRDLMKKHILAKSASWKVLAEEAPKAYKDVDEVVDSIDKAGLSTKVVKLVPIAVVKG